MSRRAGYGFNFFAGTSGDGITQDHIFESADVRNSYFNPDRLAELITGTPIVINTGSGAMFQVWAGMTDPATYDNTQWSDSLNITGAQIVTLVNSEPDANILTDSQRDAINDVIGLTSTRIPRATATGLADTEVRIIGGDMFVPGRLETESGTIGIGDIVSLSESGGFLSLVNAIDNRRYNVIDFYVPTTAASSKPRRLALTESERRFVLNGQSGTSIQNRNITGTYTASESGRINALIINTFLGINNLRIQIRNVSPGNATDIKYIPNRQAWLDGSGGLEFTQSGEHIIRIDDSPLIFDAGRQYSITFVSTSGDLAGGGSSPFLAVLAQSGSFVEMADITDILDEFTDLTDTPSSLGTPGQLVAVNSGRTALEFINSPTSGSSTFLALTDTPSAFTANRFLRINAGGTAVEFSDTLGDELTNWSHAALPSGRIPANNRRWYTYTGTGNVTRDLPLESGITSGWHSFFGNDSTAGTMFLQGDFRGSVTRIALFPQQGCEVGYNGDIFLEGPARDSITVSNFQEWTGNPLQHDMSYQGFSTNSSGINLNTSGARTALLNRNVRISTRNDRNFTVDLEPITNTDLSDVPLSSGFGFIANGPRNVLIRPSGSNTITRGTITHAFANPITLSPGASVTLVRSGNNSWNITVQSGTIT